MKSPRPAVFWFYGLSGSGKTTLAQTLAESLQEQGADCVLLDGDGFRASVSADLGFSLEDRAENIRRAAVLARQACEQGKVVIAAFITPTAALRDLARCLVSPQSFYEVYLDCDYATAAQRDPKGLYALAATGVLKDFTGKDSAFEPPLTEPDLRLNTQDEALQQSQEQLLAFAGQKLAPPAAAEIVIHEGSDALPFADPLTNRTVDFVRSIGLPVLHGWLDNTTFLPGLAIHAGRLIIDERHLMHPGDVLHEAGRLALTTADLRLELSDKVQVDPAAEMAIIAWSYAAALRADIDPISVLHPHVCQDGGGSLADNYANGRAPGVPLLQWMGLCLDDRNAAAQGRKAYPHMLKWLRDEGAME